MGWKRRVPDAGGAAQVRGSRVSPRGVGDRGPRAGSRTVLDAGRRPWVHRFRLAGFAAVLALLTWGLLRPEGPHEPFQHAAVLLHVVGFFALGLSARFAFDSIPGHWVWPPLLLAAPALEYLQAFVHPEARAFSVLDIAGNVAGIALAVLVWPKVRRVL